MSKSKINITEFAKHIDEVLNLLEDIDLSKLSNFKEIEKKAKHLQKQTEKYSKDLDI